MIDGHNYWNGMIFHIGIFYVFVLCKNWRCSWEQGVNWECELVSTECELVWTESVNWCKLRVWTVIMFGSLPHAVNFFSKSSDEYYIAVAFPHAGVIYKSWKTL
jgi:hypothetical protein